ncbi:MAG: ATP-binding protein [Desulfopila sp.]|jgi:PAS domain S-box-containing protein|nr:ATP-binding protein [Desulfopila sp.]
MSPILPKTDSNIANRSLSRRFSLALSVVVISILVVFSLAVVGYNYFKIERDLERQLSDTLHLAETSLPTAVWQMDHGSMDDILEAILINNAIASVRIISDDVMAAVKNQPQYGDVDFSYFRNDPKRFNVKSVDVKRYGESVGTFEVALAQAEMTGGIAVTVVLLLALIGVLCGAILLTSVLVTRRYIFTPLMRLESHAKIIAGGNLESTIELEGNDEFGQLASAYNLMANQLKISFETLEQKVMERTADLYLAKTEAEKASHHLSVAGAELQALLDNSPVGILFVGFDRMIQRINPQITRITGYTSEELVGGTTRPLYTSEDVYETLGQTYYPLLQSQGFCEANTEIRRKDGSLIMCHWQGRTVVAEGGIEGVVWSVEDISTRLKMEEELFKAKKLESIGIFAGGIAHDFNNLLLAIIGNISLARRVSKEDSQIDSLLASAQHASERAKDLTARLLTFAGGGEPVKSAASLSQLLQESASFILSGSNVKCDLDIPSDLWSVNMDKGQINQVIQNLVLNADQAMPEGGVVTISCSNIDIVKDQVPGLEAGPYVCVSVEDKGVGITEENIGRVFDPYFSTKVKDSNKGSGLGLAIVHSIIAKHRGIITVRSTYGKGSRFTLYLPATRQTEQENAAEENTIRFGGGRILVMDDEEMIRNVVCNMLNHLGYHSVQAEDGEEAVSKYKNGLENNERFDAVIMDLTIPGGMGGAEAVKRVLALDPEAKVIVSSGYYSDPILDNYRLHGFCNIVAKPYQLKDLARVLEETLM